MKCLSILGYQIMELSSDGSKNTKKTGILSLKGKKDGMPKKKQKTAQEYEEELEALRQENLRLTIENEYLKKLDALVSERERSEKKKSQRQ